MTPQTITGVHVGGVVAGGSFSRVVGVIVDVVAQEEDPELAVLVRREPSGPSNVQTRLDPSKATSNILTCLPGIKLVT